MSFNIREPACWASRKTGVVQKYIPQYPGKADCTLASIATVIGKTYAETADIMEIQIDPLTGAPDLSNHPGGIDLLQCAYPLAKAGWGAATIISDIGFKSIGSSKRGPDNDDMIKLLGGRKALLGYEDPVIGDHTIAWLEDRAIDCGNGKVVDVRTIPLKSITILVPIDPPKGLKSKLLALLGLR